MPHVSLSSRSLLFLIIASAAATDNVRLRTQQGVIYGQRTEASIEYLGYEKSHEFAEFYRDCSLGFNMRERQDGNHLSIWHQRCFPMAHYRLRPLVHVVHNQQQTPTYLYKMRNASI